MDAGLTSAMLARMTALRATDLNGFEGFGFDFNDGENAGLMPRAVVRELSNVKTGQTCGEEKREVSYELSAYAASEEDLRGSTDKLDTVFRRWREKTTEIGDNLDTGGSLTEFDIENSVRTQIRTGLWSNAYTLLCKISITR